MFRRPVRDRIQAAREHRRLPAPTLHHITADGRTREYYLHVPQSHDPLQPMPLMLIFHGGSGRGDMGRIMPKFTKMSAIAEHESFMAAYPNALYRNWADGRGRSREEREGIDDVAFIRALIASLSQQHPIDAGAIFAAGISNGGFFSARLGCELSDQIAAVGIVAASMAANIAKRGAPPNPVSAMLICGTDDPIVPFEGGWMMQGNQGEILSVHDAALFWAKANGCYLTPQRVDVPDIVSDGTRTHRLIYTGARASVEAYIVEGGGHTWPGGLQYLPALMIGNTSRDFNASEALWAFFKSHRR